ncbi:MAG: hypothetical protein ACPGNT_05295 [Rhodospirillales bacterium]
MTTGYPFAGHDFLGQKANYSYADCAGEDYLEIWQASRKAGCTWLKRLATSETASERMSQVSLVTAEGAFAEPDAYELEKRLALCLDRMKQGDEAAIDTLDPFIIKFEVFGRFFARYGSDDRRSAGAGPASPRAYILFAACLSEIAERHDSLKHLSALLKVCDALVSVERGDLTSADAILLLGILEQEKALVERWRRHVDDDF